MEEKIIRWALGFIALTLTVFVVLMAGSLQAVHSAEQKTGEMETVFQVHSAEQREKEKAVVEKLDEIKQELKEIKGVLRGSNPNRP